MQVIERTQSARANARAARVRSYFYGDDSSGYTPHVYELAFSNIQIFKIGGAYILKFTVHNCVRDIIYLDITIYRPKSSDIMFTVGDGI